MNRAQLIKILKNRLRDTARIDSGHIESVDITIDVFFTDYLISQESNLAQEILVEIGEWLNKERR